MQLCDDCGINPATIHLTQIKNETTAVSHLCDECAQKHGITISIEQSNEPAQNKQPETPAVPDTLCLQCGFTLSEFKSSGRLGCAHCYSAFQKDIDVMLTQIHGGALHKGKLYRKNDSGNAPEGDVNRLRGELNEAIKNENFELAASIRDAIYLLDNHPAPQHRNML
jgi:protein arginine kinase activator